MPVSFDPIHHYILITSPTTEIDMQEIYNRAMEWADEQADMSYDPPVKAAGKFPMGGGVYSDIIYVLLNGWKIKPWSGNYKLVIKGTAITEDGSPRTVLPDFGNVEIEFQVCSQGTIEQTGGSTEEDNPKVIY